MLSEDSLSVSCALAGALLLALVGACSASADGRPAFQVAGTASTPPNPSQGAAAGPAAAGSPAGGSLAAGSPAARSLADPEPPAGSSGGAASCSSSRAQAETIRQPVDVIVVMDNSQSMQDEARSVEANLNVNFAQTLADSGIDYRLILISRHRSSDNLLQRTSACITSPLSGLAQCPAAQPVFGERFFQYSVSVGSHDSLELLLDTYAGAQPDDFGLAPRGWSAWLRAAAKKVFLEITDDDARSSSESFLSQLTSLAPEQFGKSAAQADLVWHSIVGLAEKAAATDPYLPAEPVQSQLCHGNLNTVFSAGSTYQELSRLTGGLRFPICEFDGYDRVFQAIARDVASTTRIACSFAVPAPPAGQRLELDKVAVSYTPGDGSGARTLGQVTEQSQCGRDAFSIENGTISLCPEACAEVSQDARAAIDVVFSCASTLIVR